jgi:hypothetical protein
VSLNSFEWNGALSASAAIALLIVRFETETAEVVNIIVL